MSDFVDTAANAERDLALFFLLPAPPAPRRAPPPPPPQPPPWEVDRTVVTTPHAVRSEMQYTCLACSRAGDRPGRCDVCGGSVLLVMVA